MRPEWCAQDIWGRALAVQDKAIERCEAEKLSYRFPTCNGKSVLDEEVARALLEVHQRGRRDGMEEAAGVARCAFDDRPRRDSMDWNDGFDDGTKAAEYAIRAKAQEVKT